MLSSRGHVLMESFALALPLPRHLGWRELGAANTAGSGGSRDRAEQRAGAGAARPPGLLRIPPVSVSSGRWDALTSC